MSERSFIMLCPIDHRQMVVKDILKENQELTPIGDR
jgi:hypothetical protein